MSRQGENLAAIIKNVPPEVLKTVPGIPPPKGEVSNFIDPPTFMTEHIIGITITSFFMLAAVALRIYSKIATARKFGWEDYTCFFSIFLLIPYIFTAFYGVHLGFGTHEWNVSLHRLLGDEFLQVALYWTAIYTVILLFVKLSLFILYLRLFQVNRGIRIMSWIGIILCTFFYIFGSVFALAICLPRGGELRAVAIASQRCDRIRTFAWAQIPFNIITDFYLIIVPIPVVVRLQMTRAKKFRVLSVFAFGLLGCACGIANGYYRVLLAKSADITYYTGPVLLVTIMEINIGILVGCLPVIQPSILSKLFHITTIWNVLSRLSSRSKGSDGEQGSSDPLEPKENARPYLETRILDGVDRGGKFMTTVHETKTDRSWYRRSFVPWNGTSTSHVTSNTVGDSDASVPPTISQPTTESQVGTSKDIRTTTTFSVSSDDRKGHGDDLQGSEILPKENEKAMV